MAAEAAASDSHPHATEGAAALSMALALQSLLEVFVLPSAQVAE